MNRTTRIVLATGVALAVVVPTFGDIASAAPGETTTTETTITVRAGDSLAGLAWRHGVSLSALMRANSLELTSVVHPGDTLVIPAGASTASFAPGGGQTTRTTGRAATSNTTAGSSAYTVEAGDALSLIAWRNGVRLSALLDANDLSVTSVIMPGQRLRIPPATRPLPGGATTPAATNANRSSTSAARSSTAAGSSTYVVEAGDALSLIAWRNGVRLSALLDANDLSVTSVIMPGQRLRIPPATRSLPAGAATNRSAAATRSSAPARQGNSVQAMVSHAIAQVGAPYKFFSAGPDTFDCSGLVVAAFRKVGVSVPHQSRALARTGSSVDWRSESIMAGDLVFTSATNDPDMITHVGIAIDSRRWVHAVGFGRTVTIGSLPSDSKIMAVRRIAIP